MKRTALKTRLDEAQQQLTAAEGALESAMQVLSDAHGGEKTMVASALETAFRGLREAKRKVSDLTELLDAEPEPETRACPACGANIMAAATLCGYCWTRLK